MAITRDFSRNKYISENFSIYIRKNGEENTLISVTKKIAKKAVDRNRIKRLIKESIKKLNIDQNMKIIVKNNIADKKMNEVAKELEGALKTK